MRHFIFTITILFSSCCLALPTLSQTGQSVGGFSSSPDEPIEMTADKLIVSPTDSSAGFEGNVLIALENIKIKDQRWMMEKPKLEVPRVTSNVSLLLRTTMQDLVYFVSRGVHRVYSGRFAGHCPHPRSLSLSFQDSLVSNKSPCCVAFVCCKRMMSAELRKRKGRQQPQGNVLLVV